jgi:hypothetical protein
VPELVGKKFAILPKWWTASVAGILLLTVGEGTVAQLGGQALRHVRELYVNGVKHDLSLVRFVDVFADGTIVVGQPQDSRVLFYSPTGRRLATFGRRGEGPGEFNLVAWRRGFVADTFWVVDGVGRTRVTMVDRTGKLVRSVMPPTPLPPEAGTVTGIGGGPDFAYSYSNSGWLIERTFRPGLRIPASWKGQLDDREHGFVLVPHREATTRLVSAIPGYAQQCGREYVERLNCQYISTVAGLDGGPLIHVEPIHEGPQAGSLNVTSIRLSGDTVFSRRISLSPHPIPRTVLDSIRASGIALARSPRAAAQWRSAKLRTIYPPIGHGVLVGRDGTIWIGLRKTAAGNPWLILNPDGTEFGRLTVAPNVWITAGNRTHFWGTESDEDGIESIVRYRLVR